VVLESEENLFVKVTVNLDLLESCRCESQVTGIFSEHGLPMPRLLAYDPSCRIIPYPYLVQKKVGGIRLGDWLKTISQAEVESIYQTVGDVYSRLHSIHFSRSGIWTDSPYQPWGSPTDYMYQAEIVNCSARLALERGLMERHTYERAVAIWGANLDYLKDHQPTLLHGSPFLWTIYLDRDQECGWQVTKLTSLGDVLWWDPAYDLAFLQYPPCGEPDPVAFNAFQESYNHPLPERKRSLLYVVMQSFCAAMGTYVELPTYTDPIWSRNRLAGVNVFLDEIEAMQ
jgi:hypothetical protein